MCCTGLQTSNSSGNTPWGFSGTHKSYADAFVILGDSHILDAEFAFRFASIAGFRNFLAHDYEKIDQEMICGQVMSSLDDVEQYLRQIRTALGLA